MKKLAMLTVCFALIIACLSGCANTPGENSAGGSKNIEGSLEDLMQKIYDNLDDDVRLPMMLTSIVLSEDMDFFSIPWFIGSEDVKFSEGLGSEALVGAIPYSLVLLRMEDGVDIESQKQLIKDSVDPRKWICVGVDPSEVIVDNIGNLVVVIMSTDCEQIHDSFLKLAD